MARPISSSEAERLAELIDGGAVEAGDRRLLLTALVRAYARDGGDPPVDSARLTTDEAAAMAAQLMRAKDVTSFELAALFDV